MRRKPNLIPFHFILPLFYIALYQKYIIVSAEAETLGVEFRFDATTFFKDLDVLVLSIPLISLQETVDSLPINELIGKLVVDVGPLNDHPKSIPLEALGNYPDIDVLVTTPLLGMLPREEDQPKNTNNEYSNSNTGNSNTGNGVTVVATPTVGPTGIWEGRQMVFERARVANIQRCDRYLKKFENEAITMRRSVMPNS